MFVREDNTYNEIRERSLMQWLDEMEQHEDVAVRGGVRLCRDFMAYLREENEKLRQQNERTKFYLQRIKNNK